MNYDVKSDLERLDSATDEDIRRAIAQDPDAAPEIDEATLAQMRPAEELLPKVVAAYRARRGPQKKPRKVPVSIRLSPEVIAYFRDRGEGWQKQIDQVLVDYVESASRS